MRSPITAVIIEDNIESRAYLEKILKNEVPFVQILGTASDVAGGIDLIRDTQPDVIFLDIQLEDGYAFEILDRIGQLASEIVFVTGLDQYYQKAFDHFALSYILKPYTPFQVVRVVNKLKDKRPQGSNSKSDFIGFMSNQEIPFLLHVGNIRLHIKLIDVVKCIADGNYTIVHMKDGQKHMASGILKYYEDLFSQKGFIRVSRAVLINTQAITSIYKKETIVLNTGESIPISGNYRSNIEGLFEN